MAERIEKLVPWYHKVKDQCGVLTVRGAQCKNSASYIARSGLNGSTETVPACKPHADILQLDPEVTWKVKRLSERRIVI